MNAKHKNGVGAQERRKQEVREGLAQKKGGNKRRQHPGGLFTPQYSASEELGEEIAHEETKLLVVMPLLVPHQTPDLARPSLKPCFLLHLVSSSPFFGFVPSIFPSIRIFPNESALRIRWPKYWSFSISPSREYSGLISCRVDWWNRIDAVKEQS